MNYHQELTPLLNTTKDNYRLVYWVYFIYGIAMLLPWNVFITASEYFAIRFAETPFNETFQNYFSTFFTIANLTTYALVLFLQNKFTITFSPLKSIILNTIIFGILAITAKTEIQGTGYFWFIMSFIILTGGATSFFQNAVFSEASQLPPIYTQAVLCGQGLAGVIVAFSSISSMLIEQEDLSRDMNRSAFLYFISAFVITLTALIGRVLVVQLPFYRHHMSMKKPTIDIEHAYKFQEKANLFSVIKKVSGLVFAVSHVFIVTIILFPSITALIKSNRPDAHWFLEDNIFVAFHFVLFNLGDWVGRMLPMFKCLQILNTKYLLPLSILRTAFIPLFLVCNVVVSEPRQLPTLVDSDMVYFCLLGLFAVTNGWLCSLCMMAAPQLKSIQTTTEKSMTGSIMSFSLVAGLAIGGSLGFIARWMV